MNSSSDSEEDCYSNAAFKLEKLKNAYKDDKLDDSSLLNESSDIEYVTEVKPNNDRINREEIIIIEKGQDALEFEKTSHSTGRQTRSSTRKKPSDPIYEILDTNDYNETVTRKKCKRNPKKTPGGTPSRSTANKSRKRGRGRSKSSRSSHISTSQSTPIFSVGNTLEYEDQLEGQKLFSKVKRVNNVVTLDDSDDLDENEELSVKVYWKSSDYYPFKIRRYQKLTSIFKYFAEKDNVSENNLLFMYNDRILKSDDTPDTINYSIAKFIEGGVINRDVTKLVNDRTTDICNGIQIKFQCQNMKKPLEILVQRNDKLSLAMIKCAELLETPLKKLKFVFDGDSITGTMTPEELELEGGECIDVQIIT